MDDTTPAMRKGAGLIAVTAFAAIVLQFGLNVSDGETPIEAAWGLARYFTILTNILVGGTFALIALGKGMSWRWLLCLCAAIAGVGLVYHTLLSHLLSQQGWEIVADQGVHTVVPILCVLWFVLFAPVRALRWRDAFWVVIWPTAYCVYALLRGAATNAYPYPFVDRTQLDDVTLAINIVGLTGFFLVLGFALLTLVRLRGRKAG